LAVDEDQADAFGKDLQQLVQDPTDRPALKNTRLRPRTNGRVVALSHEIQECGSVNKKKKKKSNVSFNNDSLNQDMNGEEASFFDAVSNHPSEHEPSIDSNPNTNPDPYTNPDTNPDPDTNPNTDPDTNPGVGDSVLMPLVLGWDGSGVLTWSVDASFAIHNDMRSHTGAVLWLGHGALMSMSSKQKINTKSSTEAELVSVDDAMNFVVWIQLFMGEQLKTVSNDSALSKFMHQSVILQDNTSTI
jgi:hypothetical protein